MMIVYFNAVAHPRILGEEIHSRPETTHRIMLVPLDSRPPCWKFPKDSARITGCEVITPPTEILDYYSMPGNTEAIRRWIRENISGCEAVILSVDQLLYGGLLASRDSVFRSENIFALAEFLKTLRSENPVVKIYAFSILARHEPPDSIDGLAERKFLKEYGRTMDRMSRAYADEALKFAQKLGDLREVISPEGLLQYESIFTACGLVNEKLVGLAAEGIIDRLVIGQDDGEPYCMGNIIRRQLSRISEKNVFITHGADEIAMSLLSFHEARRANVYPKIVPVYSDRSVPERIMPYMAADVSTVALEKIFLTGALSANENEADITLFISANTRETASARRSAAGDVRDRVMSGKRVALVDISYHFLAEETIFPLLIKNGTPLNRLSAYSGWNTASNSIGTAIAESVLLFIAEKSQSGSYERAVACNFDFIGGRFLEDYFFLKEVIDPLNSALKKRGYGNVGDLDLDKNARWANAMLNGAIKYRLSLFREAPAYRASFPHGSGYVSAQKLEAWAYFPWPRTFEIYISPATFAVKSSNQFKNPESD